MRDESGQIGKGLESLLQSLGFMVGLPRFVCKFFFVVVCLF